VILKLGENGNLKLKNMRESLKTDKSIIYIDMDGVLVNYQEHLDEMLAKGMNQFQIYKMKGVFENLKPMPGAISAFNSLALYFDVYILSTPMWSNPDSWAGKRIWVEKNLGENAKKKLILSHNKGLVKGKYLIDDREANGVLDFEGEHIKFGSETYPDWNEVLNYIYKKEIIK